MHQYHEKFLNLATRNKTSILCRKISEKFSDEIQRNFSPKMSDEMQRELRVVQTQTILFFE